MKKPAKIFSGTKSEETQIEPEDPSALASYFVDVSTKEETSPIGFPRASNLYDCCIRQLVIGTKTRVRTKNVLGLTQKIIFGYGNAVHFWLQNSDLLFKERRGLWRCSSCGWISPFGPQWKDKCKKCGARKTAFVYHEFPLKVNTNKYKMTGHPDMFIEVNGRLRVVEIKSINGDDFSKLIIPAIDYTWQINSYIWAARRDRRLKNVSKKGYVVYITKQVVPGSFPVKYFPITTSDEILRRIKNKLQAYTIGLRDYPGNLPIKHTQCSRNARCYRARSCPVQIECFKI